MQEAAKLLNMVKINKKGILSGRIEGMVYRELGGVQIIQSRPTGYRDANSKQQQQQRKGMRNILAAYGLMKYLLRENFEEAGNPLSVYRRFIHYNLLIEHVELSAEDYGRGLCVPAPYIISSGSLPALDLRVEGNCLAFDIDEKDWQRGDLIRFYQLKTIDQSDAADTPCYLDASFEETVYDYTMANRVVSAPLPHGAYAYVHLRHDRHSTLCSPQHLIVI